MIPVSMPCGRPPGCAAAPLLGAQVARPAKMLLCCLLRAAHTPGGIPHPATPPLGALPTACALCTAIEALSFTIVDPSLPSFPPNIWRLRTPPPLHFRFSEVMVRCSGVGWTCVSMRWCKVLYIPCAVYLPLMFLQEQE